MGCSVWERYQMSLGSGHLLRRWVSAGEEIGKEGQRLEVLNSRKGVKCPCCCGLMAPSSVSFHPVLL